MTLATPEARAALWQRLARLAGAIRDDETRAQYMATWRARFDDAFPPPPPGIDEGAILPDGRDVPALDKQPERVRATLMRLSSVWLMREVARGHQNAKQANGFAWWLGRRMTCGLIGWRDAEGAWIDLAATRDDLDAEQHADMLKSLWLGMRRPYDIGPELLAIRCAGFQRTDLGNAERFRERFGRDFLYTTAKGWLVYDSRRYRVLVQEKDVTPAEVQGAVFDTVRAIQEEAALIAASGVSTEGLTLGDEAWQNFQAKHDLYRVGIDHPGAMDRVIDVGGKPQLLSAVIAKWGRTSESAGKLGSIATLAKRWVTVDINDFDRDPMLLNCRNGTLEFQPPDDEGPARVRLREHRRDDMLTKLTACDYDPQAAAPEWQKLVRWAQPKKERRRYLRQWLGYCLTGDMGEQIFHIWWGPSAANGKSTVGNAAREATGDYGDITNVETFLDEGPKKRGDQATPDIVRLPGVRFLTSGEPGPGSKFNEPLINSVTGGDPMLARDNFRSFFRFAPAFKWTVWCNKKPDIVQGTEGIWRRAKVLLWESHLREHEKDRGLPDRLKAEYAGILAWMVRGTIDWMQHGFIEPEDVTAQSAAYRDDSDPLASFLRLCTADEATARVQSSVLYGVYCAWAKAAGENAWTNKGLTRALKDRGYDNKASNGMQWLGLKLVKGVHDFLDERGEVRSDIDDSGDWSGEHDGADGARAPPPGAGPPDDWGEAI